MLDKAPVLTPSSSEWKDPYKYISSLRQKYEKYGIVKIIPPKSWKPEYSLGDFRFKTRIQNLSDLNGINRSSKNYFLGLRKFHAQIGNNLLKMPIVDKNPIDLLLLSKVVKEIGGYSAVVKDKNWKKVAQEMGYFYHQNSSTKWIAKSIQGHYEKWIKPFEDYTNQQGYNSKTCLAPKLVNETLIQLDLCKVCRKGDDEERMLLCDGCNQGFHLYCLEPKMAFVPETDWFCATCLKQEDLKKFGFDDGNSRSLEDFKFIAAKFKQDWFYKKFKSSRKITCTEVEDEFWRLVNSVDDVLVEYGADLHSSKHGSGFPTFERDPKNKYSRCSWNLNNLPILGKSVLRHVKNDISGIIVPWLYVGMVFTAFCWHTEDHYTYSINYLHWGDPKTWYGIPSADADMFENVMKELMPDLFEANPDLLFHLTTMLSPMELKERGVSVYTIDQNPGEFVITFPRGYHSGFNQGCNFAEAANLALPDWFGYGRDCIERYREYCKKPVFCHDELLFATIDSDLDSENAQWLSSDLKYIKDHAINARLNLAEEYGSMLTVEQIGYQKNDPRTILQCYKCHAFCYLNAILCRCNTSKVSCEIHVKDVITCACKSLILQSRLSNEELIQLQDKVDSVAAIPVKWSDKLKELLRENERPHIMELNQLLAAAEASGELLDEMIDLKVFLNEANVWIEHVNTIFGKQRGQSKSEINSGFSKGHKIFGPEKTLSNLHSLLTKAQKMTLDCPEVRTLKDTIARAEQFRAQSRILLDDCDASFKDLNDLYNQGIALAIGMEELDELEDRMSLVGWEENAKNLLSQPATEIKPFTVLIKSGLELGVRPDHDLMVALKKIKAVADEWRDYAHNFLRFSTLKISSLFEIERVLSEAKSTPYYKATMQQLEQLYDSIKIWFGKACELIDMKIDGTLLIGNLKTQNYELIKELLIESEALSMSFDIPEILDNIAASERWLQKGKKVLCRPRSSKTFRLILSDLLSNVDVFASTDVPKESLCFCRKDLKDETLISCVECNYTYHISCIGITKKMMSNITDFICFLCSGKFDAIKRKSQLPSLVELQVYLMEGQSLSLVPQEVHIIEDIVEKLIRFKKFLFEFLAKDGAKDKCDLRDLLRSSAGLDVIIDPEMTQLIRRAELMMQHVHTDNSEIVNDEAGPRYCICREVYSADKPMIGCDQCSEWYHWECLGLSSRNVNAMRDDGFICTICSTENALPKNPKILSSSDLHNRGKLTPLGKNPQLTSAVEEIENSCDDSPVKVLKKAKISNSYTTSKGQVSYVNIQEEESDELLPPPPRTLTTWSSQDAGLPSGVHHYPIPSFLYSPFVVAADNLDFSLEKNFMNR